jgi:alpha-L-fucosidase
LGLLLSTYPETPANFLVDDQAATFWLVGEGRVKATLEFTLKESAKFDCAELQEEITRGQRIEEFAIEAWNGQNWFRVFKGTIIVDIKGSSLFLKFSQAR